MYTARTPAGKRLDDLERDLGVVSVGPDVERGQVKRCTQVRHVRGALPDVVGGRVDAASRESGRATLHGRREIVPRYGLPQRRPEHRQVESVHLRAPERWATVTRSARLQDDDLATHPGRQDRHVVRVEDRNREIPSADHDHRVVRQGSLGAEPRHEQPDGASVTFGMVPGHRQIPAGELDTVRRGGQIGGAGNRGGIGPATRAAAPACTTPRARERSPAPRATSR